MKNFTNDFMMRKLSQEVICFISELEQPHRHSNHKDLSKHLERLYRKGIFTKQDYLFCTARVLLNDFSYMVEEKVGRGCQAGFTFYCYDRKVLMYGAGAHYPASMKEVLIRHVPVVDMEGKVHYTDDIIHCPVIEEWFDNPFKPLMLQDGMKSFTSKRLQMNGESFGTFDMYFPIEGACLTDEEVAWVKEKMQPIKEKLFHIREEMLEAVDHAMDNLGANYSVTHLSKHFLGVAIVGLQLYEGLFPLAGKLITMA